MSASQRMNISQKKIFYAVIIAIAVVVLAIVALVLKNQYDKNVAKDFFAANTYFDSFERINNNIDSSEGSAIIQTDGYSSSISSMQASFSAQLNQQIDGDNFFEIWANELEKTTAPSGVKTQVEELIIEIRKLDIWYKATYTSINYIEQVMKALDIDSSNLEVGDYVGLEAINNQKIANLQAITPPAGYEKYHQLNIDCTKDAFNESMRAAGVVSSATNDAITNFDYANATEEELNAFIASLQTPTVNYVTPQSCLDIEAEQLKIADQYFPVNSDIDATWEKVFALISEINLWKEENL